MPIVVNSTNIKTLKVNSTNMKKGYANQVLVYSADETIFENGVLSTGTTTNNFTIRNRTDLEDGFGNNKCLQMVSQATSFDSDNQYGYVQFNVSDFSSISVEFTYAGFATQAKMDAWCGFDIPSEDWESDLEYLGGVPYYNESTVVTKTYNTSSLSGNKQFIARLRVGNNSGDASTVAFSKFIIRKIIGYV